MVKSDKCVLIVYARQACHLCEQMILALQEQQKQVSFGFQVIDIDTDSALVAKFNDKVPVLVSVPDQEEICHYYLDLKALDDYLAKIR